MAKLFSERKNNLTGNIWAIAGGKGGVGKSLLTANLGIFLAQNDFRVIVVDADLGCPNLHTCLGMKGASRNITDFLKNRVDSLDESAVDTGIENLKLVSGVRDDLTTANFTYAEKQKLIRGLENLESDYVILDLSAGITYNTLDLFLTSTTGILISVPEPTSVESLYRFMKAMILRVLKNKSGKKRIKELIKKAADEKAHTELRKPAPLLEEIREIDPEQGEEFERVLENLNLKLVMNQVRNEDDIKLGEEIESVTRNYFGIDMDFTGYIDYDFSAWEAVQGNKILLEDYPDSVSTRGIIRIGKELAPVE